MKKVFHLSLIVLFFMISGCSTGNDSNEYINTGYKGHYIANSNTGVFHKDSCRYISQILSEHKVFYDSREEVISAGFRACKVCKP